MTFNSVYNYKYCKLFLIEMKLLLFNNGKKFGIVHV